jgi:hypothetical protein
MSAHGPRAFILEEDGVTRFGCAHGSTRVLFMPEARQWLVRCDACDYAEVRLSWPHAEELAQLHQRTAHTPAPTGA